MNLLAAGQASGKKKSPLSTPLKPLAPVVTRSASMPSPSDQIVTPEKPIELPRRSRSRSVAFSLKEVKKAASGLLRSTRVSPDHGEIGAQSKSAPPAEGRDLGPDNDGARAHPTGKSRVEKYDMLLEFFNYLVSSIRLLHLKGRMTSFSKVCPQVESLTNRRFSYGHLAQLMNILPEAICIKKILLRDEATSCMKPDLQITLQTDAFGPSKDQKMGSGYSLLTKVFRHWLVKFSEEHPEGDDVPEMDLPEPFNQTKPSVLPQMTTHLVSKSVALNTRASSGNPSQQETIAPSHMPRSFQKRFSQKVVEKLPSGHLAMESSGVPPISSTPSPINYVSGPPICKSLLLGSSHIHLPSVSPIATKEETVEEATPVHGSPQKDVSMGTPAKTMSTPARLMSITPQLQTPKRCRTDTIEDSTPVKTMRRPTRTKLFTTPVKNAKPEDEETEVAVDDVLQSLPKALLQSVREKERKAMKDQEAGVADAEKRQNACLPAQAF